MDVLKWLLKVSIMIAFMFLGLKAQPKHDNSDNNKRDKSALIRILG